MYFFRMPKNVLSLPESDSPSTAATVGGGADCVELFEGAGEARLGVPDGVAMTASFRESVLEGCRSDGDISPERS